MKRKNKMSRLDKLWESYYVFEAEGNQVMMEVVLAQIDEIEGVETMADFERKQKGGRY